MKIVARLIAVLALLAPWASLAGAAAPQICPDRIVVRARHGTRRDDLHQRLKAMGLRARLAHPNAAQMADESAPLVAVDVQPHEREQLLNALAARSDVGYAAPVYLYTVAAVPNDPDYANQYQYPVMNAPAAWDITKGSASMPIAICDTGIDNTNPDLAARLMTGYDAYSGGTDTHDLIGHGTAVAGCAAAITNNGSGVAGMTWLNPILPVRIIDASGFGPSDVIASGIRWAVDHGARVINCSFSPLQDDIVVKDAAAYARGQGALVFIAMGNDGQRVAAAADPNIDFIGATDASDAKASFSNTGPAVKLCAPGVNILTTQKGGTPGPWNGTSFSCPLVAGTAALVWAANPSLSNAQVEQVLIATAHDLGTAGWDETFGYGRVDAGAAVKRAVALATPATKATMASPAPGATLASTSVTFTINPGSGATAYYLYAGTAANPTAYAAVSMGTAHSATVSTLPADGSTVQVTLWSYLGGAWQNVVYTYRAFTASVAAVIASPPPSTVLTSSYVTFSWNAVAGAQQYYIYIGKTAGAADYGSLNLGTARACSATLPYDGSLIYVRLWTYVSGGWKYTDAIYRASSTP